MDDRWNVSLSGVIRFHPFCRHLRGSILPVPLTVIFEGRCRLQPWLRRCAHHLLGNPVGLLLVFISRCVDDQLWLNRYCGMHRNLGEIVT